MAWAEDEAIGPDVASAGQHVSERIGRDAAAQPDLEEALEASRYASHPYSSHPKEWPPLVEVAETRQLPPILVERYNAVAGEGTALCGIFSEIHRAWATVDNSFFIWRFDKWDGQCQEYNANEQVICAVGLARAKPGIFVEAIQYLLVLATPIELMLVGVCCSASGDGTNPYAELSLQPLPEYMISTDGVTVTCITCTDKGQIFLAGRDGHIYELQYTTGSGWRKRCRKVCLTAGLGSLLSRWVLPNAFKFSAVDPIVDMVIDEERNTIYARTEGMKLQLFDLGASGDGPLKKITEERNLVDPRDAPYGSRRPNAQRAARSPKPSIVCIAPLSAMESKWLHAVAVLSDGKRLFLSTSGGSSSVGLSTGLQRPSCLKIVATRPSPPLGVGGGLTFGAVSAAGRAQPEDLALKVESAFYSAGALIMSDSSATAMSSLLAVQKDSAAQLSLPSTFGTASRSSRALRETVSALPVEGRMLCASDVFPPPDAAFIMQSLYADVECFAAFGKPSEKSSIKLWAKGDLPTQHILPRRRIVVFNTMGLMEVVFNRPVDILRKLLDGNTLRSQLEEFFNRFGTGEAAAMCLMLATKLLYTEDSLISNAVSEKAAEAFEDPALVGMPQIDGSTALSNTRTQAGGFSMGQVVQEAQPIFSGAYEGLCLCSSRLLYPIWELPIMVVRGLVGSNDRGDGVVVCRLSTGAMKVLESKIRSLETFFRSRRNKRRGLYGYVAGLGDSGSILYKAGPIIGSGGHSSGKSPYSSHIRDVNPTDQSASNKKQRLPCTSAELAAMEVRAIECLRRLLRRSGEALFLLQLICQHNVARLVQTLGSDLRKKLVQLTFHQLVCSEDGDQLAMRLISALMEYYIGPEGTGTIEEISTKLREGCPSYFNESDYKYYLAVECLERASVINNYEQKDILARDAYNLLTKIPDSADLSAICKRFENLRFYEAVVRLPLQKAQALDSHADVINGQIDGRHHDIITAQREQCYKIVMNALCTLKGVGQSGTQGADKSSGSVTAIDPVSRGKYIRQIIQLSVQWPDTMFHEHLYKTLIELGLENELLEYGGSDLVAFLQSAGRKHHEEERLSSGEELVGDEDVARALLGACKDLPEPVLAVYDQLLSNGAIVPSLNLKLRLLRSVLAILREWGMSVVAHKLGTTTAGASFFLDGTFSLNQTGSLNKGIRDKIISLANRYMTEVRRLNLPQSQTETVYRGFRELEEKLLSQTTPNTCWVGKSEVQFPLTAAAAAAVVVMCGAAARALNSVSRGAFSWKPTGFPQQTLAAAVSRSGVGLHSGARTTARLIPARAGEGRYFVVEGEGEGETRVAAEVANAEARSPLCTTLRRGGARVRTVEHLLSAMEALGVDNCRVEVSGGDEIPLLDGSAQEWVEAIRGASLCAAKDSSGQKMEKLAPEINKPVYLQKSDCFVAALPSSRIRITYGIDFPKVSAIGCQRFATVLDANVYSNKIAPARTFCVFEEVEKLRAAGLIKGGSLENAMVCSTSGGWLNPPLRFEDEPCRHKSLDLIGDFSLLAQNGNQGFPIAHVVAYKAGHALHTDFLWHLLGRSIVGQEKLAVQC
uniref:UDP-3-O-acyl-N-acetylglucosamine deacetylase n=1 Tax=Leersia perrieri TaxID=77586 RepID=A0A0D9VRE4_9ORYZ